MKLMVVLAVLIGTLVLACSTAAPAPAEPTPNIDATAVVEPTLDIEATVEAKLAQERAVDATVEARLKEERASQPTATPYPTYTPVPTATPPPKPANTPAPQRINTPEPTPTDTPTLVPTATSVPTPTPRPIPTATSVPTPTPRPLPTATPTPAPTPIPTSVPVYSSCEGKTIRFKIGNVWANESIVWLAGGGDELNLTASTASSPSGHITSWPISAPAQRVPPHVVVGSVNGANGTSISAWDGDTQIAATTVSGGSYSLIIDKETCVSTTATSVPMPTAVPSAIPTPIVVPTPAPTVTPAPTPTPTPNPYTTLGGVLASNTTLTVAQSPYQITSTLQIPENVTLRINAGVEITSQASDMFLVHGKLIAEGNANNKIVLDAGGGNIFNGKQAEGSMSVSVEHSILKNGASIWPATGYGNEGSLTLRNSEILDMGTYSYIWYPVNSVMIEKNVFSNSAGFSVGFRAPSKVTIRYNRFETKSASSGYWVRNWACYDASSGGQTCNFDVQFNSFVDDGTAVELQAGYDSTKLNATNNYWGTTDESVISNKIYDSNDDITTAGYIQFTPYLMAPHSSTP